MLTAILTTANTTAITTKIHRSASSQWSKGFIKQDMVPQLGSINLPTTDAIEYNLEVLGAMTTEALLLQIIARKDLERPNREGDIVASIAKAVLDEKVEAMATQFEVDGLNAVATAIRSAYETAVTGGG